MPRSGSWLFISRSSSARAKSYAGNCAAADMVRARTSSPVAMPFFVSAASTATIARPHAEVSAFISSESFVNGVLPGNNSHAIPMPGVGSSAVR